MRISDWSSDVCSSDLDGRGDRPYPASRPQSGRVVADHHRHADPRGTGSGETLMAKARASNQLAFAFDLPKAARHPAAMAGSDARTARMVGEILNSDPRAREVIAAEMSVLLDDQVSKAMLDAGSAPGKDAHHISRSRLRAL